MGSFQGVAETYHSARPGYPIELRDHLVDIGGLHPDALVLDLGAGTGQLAVLMSDVADTVVAMDPEPDMVRVGREATRGRTAIRWVIGSDREVAEKVTEPIDLVVIGNAFHHMSQATLLAGLDMLVVPTGMVVVCSSSVPVRLQDADWSRALCAALSDVLGRPVGGGGVPDHVADAERLRQSAFSTVCPWTFEREKMRPAASVVGEVISSADGRLDEADAEKLHRSLVPYLTDGCVAEMTLTSALIATRQGDVHQM